MSFGASIASVFRKYGVFRGVATRPEYWWFTLFSFLVAVAINLLMTATGEDNIDSPSGPVSTISLVWSLGTLIPSLAVTVRRFHDAGFSGKWLWLYLVPVVGLVFAISSAVPVIWGYWQGSLVGDELIAAVLGLVGVASIPILAGLAIGIFALVVTLRPSKSAAEGNKYAV
jgi:uncharacterized membrane protein YhaH (DUF805 family)